MAFLDETGLAELWKLIQAEDEKLADAISAAPKVATGSYVGTGVYSDDDLYGGIRPISLSFDFAPKILAIYATGSQNSPSKFVGTSSGSPFDASWIVACESLSTSFVSGGLGKLRGYVSDFYTRKSEDGKTIYWHAWGGADQMYNSNMMCYYYMAIG